MEWGSAVDWFKAITGFLTAVAGLGVQLVFFYLIYNMMRPMLATMGGRSGSDTPAVSAKMLLRRLFCAHKGVLARGRTKWGKVTTLCARCGVDVNDGKPREEWR
jgi:hypothetical protein